MHPSPRVPPPHVPPIPSASPYVPWPLPFPLPQLREGGFPANQTSPFLQTDTIDAHVFVSVPAAGLIYVVDVHHGGHEGHGHAPGEEEDEEAPVLSLAHTLAVGGFPTAMTLAYMPGVTAF